MSYEIEVEDDGRGVVVTWRGIVTGRVALEANGEMYSKDPGGRYEYQIWDYTNVDGFDVTSEELRSVAMQDYSASAVNPRQLVAVVGDADLLDGLDKLYRVFAGVWTQFESKTFPSMAEAREWVEQRETGS